MFLTEDLCVVDGDSFYIRAVLELPIKECNDTFVLGVWVSQSEQSYNRYMATLDQNQSGDGSFGWLPVTFKGYHAATSEIEFLPTDVFWGDERPSIKIHEDQDHVLAIDQRQGLSWERAVELAILMHTRDAEQN